jgi:hypothetical protein
VEHDLPSGGTTLTNVLKWNTTEVEHDLPSGRTTLTNVLKWNTTEVEHDRSGTRPPFGKNDSY